jgi:hypothetical protein
MNSFFGYADSGKSANFFVPTTPVWAADAGRIDMDQGRRPPRHDNATR